MSTNPLAGYDMVMSITEASLNGIIKSKFGSKVCPSSYEALLTPGSPWDINHGNWDNSKLAQETDSNYTYSINTGASNNDTKPSPPSITINSNADVVTGAFAVFTIPFADGGIFCYQGKSYSLDGTILKINVPIILNDITDQINSVSSSNYPNIGKLQSDLNSNSFLLNELVIDLNSTTTSDIADSSVFNENLPSNLHTPLYQVMQQLMANKFILGYMPILNEQSTGTGLNTNSKNAFQATSIQLSTTQSSSDNPSVGGMLNLCMLVGGTAALTASGSGLFTTSLYDYIPTYSNNNKGSASGLFFFNPELFNYYMINPYLDKISSIFKQGHDDDGNGSWTGFTNFNYSPTYNSDNVTFNASGQGVHGSKTYGEYGSEHFGVGVKFNYPKDPGSNTTPQDGDPTANSTMTLSSIINQDSTNLQLGGQFTFEIQMIVQEELTVFDEKNVIGLTLSTDGDYKSSSYPNIQPGQPGEFQFALGLDAPSSGDTSSQGTLYITNPQSINTVLGIESQSIKVYDSSDWNKMLNAVLGVLTFGLSNIVSWFNGIISKDSGSNELLKILEGDIGNVVEQIFDDASSANQSLQDAPLIISDSINYSITDLNIITSNNAPAICCSVHYEEV